MTSAARPRPRTRPVEAWIDLASPSHPFFFRALVDELPGVTARVTVRAKTETVPLAREVGFDYRVVGRDFDDARLRTLGVPLRTLQLTLRRHDWDVALAARNAMCVLAAKAHGVPSIHFTDNDITAHVDGLRIEELYSRFEAAATHNVVPAAFETRELTDRGADPASVHTYGGTKEDVYAAALDPDPSFPDRLPFDSGEYVVVRPEALTAAYIDADASIVPDLLAGFAERDVGVVYLPRGRGDESFAEGYDDGVYVPPEPPNGLQLAWHARCVLTGSGTMSREAAAMETPAVSFFPSTLLSVDAALVEEGRVFHSRDAAAIVEYVDGLTDADAAPDLDRSQSVRREVADLVAGLVERET